MYALKCRDAKVIIGCAYFHDLLKPASFLCKSLQADEVCVVTAVEAILKTGNSLHKLKATCFEELPIVSKVLSCITHDDSSSTYKGADLTKFPEAVSCLKSKHPHFSELVQGCLRDRLATQESNLLSQVLTIVATQGWKKMAEPAFAYSAIEAISLRFRNPLEHAKVDLSLLKEECDDMHDYAKRYLDLVTKDANEVWWKLFNSTNAKKWGNILRLVELLFSLPMSNGHVERVFSQLKLIKTVRRMCLGEDRLHSLLRISTSSPPLLQWNASQSVQLWWSDMKRRSVNDVRALPSKKPRTDTPDCESPSTSHAVTLEDWEDLVLSDQ